MKDNEEIDHEFTDEIVCPHCGKEMMDSWEWSEYGEEDCGDCGKRFSYERIVTVDYSTQKIE